MNKIWKKILKTISLGLCVCSLVGGAVGTINVLTDASAETSENRYFHAENAVATSEWVTSTSWHGVNGLKTTLAIEEGASYAKMTYNGVVNPTQTLTISSPSVTDEGGSKTTVGGAVVLTYTAVSDQTKKLSIISGYNTSNGFGHVSVAFTDDLTISGYNGIDNSTKKTSVANMINNGGYASWAYCTGSSVSWFLNYGGGAQITLSSAGVLKYDSHTLADLTNEGLYTALGYTAEYATALVTELAKGAIMSVTVYEPNVSAYAFNISGINGGSGWTSWTDLPLTRAYAVQKADTLYKGVTYKASDLFDWYSMYRNASGENVSYVNGFLGSTTWGDGTYFQIGKIDPVSDTTFFVSETGTYSIITAAMAGPNSETGLWETTQSFNFQVINGDPTISAVENATFVSGLTHDLSDYFDVWYLGENPTYEYSIDGKVIPSSMYVSDGQAHTVGLKVTDQYGNNNYFEYTVPCMTITVQDRVETTGYYNKAVVLPIPQMPDGTNYTIKVYDGEELLTTSAQYTFAKEGTYRIVYEFNVFGLEEAYTLETEFVLSLKYETPIITVDGTYKSSYLQGDTLTVLAASASDGLTTYEVDFEIYIGGVKQTVSGETFKLSVAGDYEVLYYCIYNETERAYKSLSFKVNADTEKPQIVVNGSYAATYNIGDTVLILDASVADNSGADLAYTVEVYNGTEKIETLNGELKIEKAGNYRIVYQTTDNAGNNEKVQLEFSVEAKNSGCSSALADGSIILITLAGVAALLVLRRKKKNEN